MSATRTMGSDVSSAAVAAAGQLTSSSPTSSAGQNTSVHPSSARPCLSAAAFSSPSRAAHDRYTLTLTACLALGLPLLICLCRAFFTSAVHCLRVSLTTSFSSCAGGSSSGTPLGQDMPRAMPLRMSSACFSATSGDTRTTYMHLLNFLANSSSSIVAKMSVPLLPYVSVASTTTTQHCSRALQIHLTQSAPCGMSTSEQKVGKPKASNSRLSATARGRASSTRKLTRIGRRGGLSVGACHSNRRACETSIRPAISSTALAGGSADCSMFHPHPCSVPSTASTPCSSTRLTSLTTYSVHLALRFTAFRAAWVTGSAPKLLLASTTTTPAACTSPADAVSPLSTTTRPRASSALLRAVACSWASLGMCVITTSFSTTAPGFRAATSAGMGAPPAAIATRRSAPAPSNLASSIWCLVV
mmetsp:Transcript_13780/g.33887  ORF Transcript_13780/g.33887 Transcript_13780/m.33887 type:complete len:416 (-) Transcript_13780:1242-2489(-)